MTEETETDLSESKTATLKQSSYKVALNTWFLSELTFQYFRGFCKPTSLLSETTVNVNPWTLYDDYSRPT